MYSSMISLSVFLIITIGLAGAISCQRMANARKLILADAESKGWKNTKIKMGWWDFIVTYQDESGKQYKTHYATYFDKIIWREDTKGLYMSKEAFKTKSKYWKIVSVICALCFLYLFVGYEFEQIPWNVYKYTFAKNGYAVKLGRQYAIGVESIIRGEEALRLILKSKPDQSSPKKGKEFLILNLKIKNINRKAPAPWTFHIMDLDTKPQYSYPDHNRDLDIDLPPIGNFLKMEALEDIPFGETRINSTAHEVPIACSIKNIRISAHKAEDYAFLDIPFSRNPFKVSNVAIYSYFIIVVSMIFSALTNRWYFLLRSKKSKGYVIVPLVMLSLLFLTSTLSFTWDLFILLLMLGFFSVSWWLIILLKTTRVWESCQGDGGSDNNDC